MGSWYGHEIIGSKAPNGGGGHSRITTTTAVQSDGEEGPDGTCSAAFGQCGGKNWNGPTCCQSGCRCRHEGEWYSQCEPPAGNHMCGAVETVILAEQGQDVHLMDRVGSAVSLNQVMAGVAMMLVMGAGLTAIKCVRRQQQLSRDVETGTLLRSEYEEEDEDTEEEQMRVE